ncbi:phosphodiester glycosidase family protein [Novosphingobium sp.]|uniref:phosphodiester glycosidase family protein n=1 Tax=Novosphingobium sp. TaxID=1874826 RepID=UPI00286EA3D0|nr:phosphodiester glycosidase family protein [Novosphingobium sp.]
MNLRRILIAALVVLVGVLLYRNVGSAPAPKAAPAGDCTASRFEDAAFTECLAVPGKHQIALRLKGQNGLIFRGFPTLAQDPSRGDIAFAVNGGMYDTGSRPIGYYVENGERLRKLNQANAEGNFYLKPNGVFFGDAAGNWRVLSSEDFAATVTKRPQFGTQSGPMLLIAGKLHPSLAENGASLKLRNSVCVDAKGAAHFAISDEPVSFGQIARLMKRGCGDANALFLDGTVSSLWHPAGGRMDVRFPLGPLIVVTSLRKEPAK